MRDQEILGLYEAYNQVYSEGSFDNLIDTGASIIKKPVQDYANKRVGGLAGVLGIPGAVAGQKVDQTATDLKNRKYGKALNTVVSGVRTLTQSYDLYDVILSHLLDEGFASDEKSAEAILGSMSEAWIGSIVEKTIVSVEGGGKRKYTQSKDDMKADAQSSKERSDAAEHGRKRKSEMNAGRLTVATKRGIEKATNRSSAEGPEFDSIPNRNARRSRESGR